MVLKFSDRPQLNYGGNQRNALDAAWARLPANARPIASAPISSRPVKVFEPSGKSHWALYHRDGWRTLAPYRDHRDNTVSFQNLVLQIQRVAWRATLAGCLVTVHQHLDGTSV